MNWKIDDCSSLCNIGSATHNEDVVGYTNQGAWVLDGATGLNGKNLVSNDTDARWYVLWWNNYLLENISKAKSLKEIMLDGITQITLDYNKKLNGSKVNKLDLPSSSIAVVKIYRDKLEYLLLGDCVLFTQDKVIKDRTLCKLDDIVYSEMINKINNQNKSFKQAREEVQDIVINNRLKRNMDNGYWTLDFSKQAIENSLHGYLSIDNNSSFMLASDGFTCACDRYELFGENELLDIAERHGIEYIYNSLREVEEQDKSSIKIPRFKVNDDSSCIYFNFKQRDNKNNE